MKKSIFKLLNICIVLAIVLQSIVVPVASADSGVTISVSQEEAKTGEEVTLSVNIENNVGISGFKLWLEYDKSMLTPVSINMNPEIGGDFNSNMSEPGIDIAELDKVNAMWYSTAGTTYNGCLYTVTFKVSESAGRNIPVTLTMEELVDNSMDLNDITAQVVSGGVTATDVIVEYDVTYSVTEGGSLDTKVTTVNDGDSITLSYICDTGYILGKLYYEMNGEKTDIVPLDGKFTISNITGDVCIYAEFVKVDKSGLEELISDAQAYITNEKYTQDSVSVLQTAIADAQKVYDNASADAEAVEAAIDLINDAIANLTVKTFYVFVEEADNVVLSAMNYEIVEYGDSIEYQIVAQKGYEITDILVNGESTQLSGNKLILENITDNKTITIKTVVKKYSVNIAASVNGKITADKTNPAYGENSRITITPDSGYIIADVKIDGESVGACSSYVIENISADHTVSAEFVKAEILRTVTATAGNGGKISPEVSVVNDGGTAVFIVEPETGYSIDHVLVNGSKQSVEDGILILQNVNKDTVVEAIFRKNTYTVTSVSGSGGSVVLNYNGEAGSKLSVAYTDSVQIDITPDSGYELKYLYVNGIPVKATVNNGNITCSAKITEATTIVAKFIKSITSSYNDEVKKNGVPSDVNADNAEAKKLIFEGLAEKYETLTDEEKLVCSGAYATVLSVLERANAYIMLNDTDIENRIKDLPSADKLTAANVTAYEAEINELIVIYNNLTNLAKSLINYNMQNKLEQISVKLSRIKQETSDSVEYFCGLIESVPTNITTDNIADAYNQLKKAETIYYTMTSAERAQVSDATIRSMVDKLADVTAKLRLLYITPFVESVENAEKITVDDSAEIAEEKRVKIYNLMNTYDLFAKYIQNMISDDIIEKLNELYESANVTVSTVFNETDIHAIGDIAVEAELVIAETDEDMNMVSDMVGQDVYQALDISLEVDGNKVQPDSKIQIKVPVDGKFADKNPRVMHVDGDNVYDTQARVITENGRRFIVWSTDHFSCFAILYDADDKIIFDSTSIPEDGETITATAGADIDTSGCDLWIAGYDKDNRMTFVNKSNTSEVTATVKKDTVVIKAMLWKDVCTPVKFAQMTKSETNK